ncbi:iron dependent repressor, metal binding and dimerization domain protein [Thermodesulfovibrio hydrogeniphilus]
MKQKKILYNFLTQILKVSPETALRDVHKIEHDPSSETIEKIIEFTRNFSR